MRSPLAESQWTLFALQQRRLFDERTATPKRLTEFGARSRRHDERQMEWKATVQGRQRSSAVMKRGQEEKKKWMSVFAAQVQD